MLNESEPELATCHRYVDDHPDLTNEPAIMVIFAVLYVHIFVLGIVGNVAVLYLTLKNRHLQSVQNIFILNLAASDVLMCLTSFAYYTDYERLQDLVFRITRLQAHSTCAGDEMAHAMTNVASFPYELQDH
ncbi:hypothetical protein COOONC_01288 [Cooperia oncophora]